VGLGVDKASEPCDKGFNDAITHRSEVLNMARVYVVLPKNAVTDFGHKPMSDSPFNAHALCAVKATKEGNDFHSMFVESVISWGFKEANLQALADKRNESIEKMRMHLDSKEIEID